MENQLLKIDWHEQNEDWNGVLDQLSDAVIHTMNQGFEAEVARIDLEEKSFVLKTWNKDSRPNISMQYRLLKLLADKGISVPKPLAWGTNRDENHQVLLTTFEGTQDSKYDAKAFTDFGILLASIHHIALNEEDQQKVLNYGFLDYFYSGIQEYPDLHAALIHLLDMTSMNKNAIIHGDYHWGNVVEKDGQYSVIDWTNGQLGDARFDFAHSLVFIQLIFSAEWRASVFRTAYLTENPIPEEEIQVFEAMVYLKWLMSNRRGFQPFGPKAIDKVIKMIKANPFLQQCDLAEIAKPKTQSKSKGSSLNIVYNIFPLLQSENVFLKKINEANAEQMCPIYFANRTCNMKQLLSLVGHYERDFHKKKCVTWGIFSSENPEVIVGVITAHFNKKDANVLVEYTMNRSSNTSNIATEAIKILLAYVFDTVKMTCVHIDIAATDNAAKAELLRNGFSPDGSIHQGLIRTGNGKEKLDLQTYRFQRVSVTV